MTILAKLLEGDFVNASSNLTMPGAALLKLMRLYLGDDLTLKDLKRAAGLSPHLDPPATTPRTVSTMWSAAWGCGCGFTAGSRRPP